MDSEGMRDTPGRVWRYWVEATAGLRIDPDEPLRRTFPCDHDEIVLVRDIALNSLCEHHLLPFHGVAHVAYIPAGRVVGLSKIPRCIEILAARPQMQERLTDEIAAAIERTLAPSGVAVVISAVHSCMAVRGVKKMGSRTVTSKMTGAFRENPAARAEVMEMLKL